MTSTRRFFLFSLRISLGWLLAYAGITKILDPSWSAAGYIASSKTLPALYTRFLDPSVLPTINILNEWGLALLGISLILGAYVRWSAPLGAILMILYYLPILSFPYAGDHSYIVDEHIIYALVLLYMAATNAGLYLGIDGMRAKRRR